VRDLEIQRRENDLVVGSFGRGIYILDDYTPLREVTEEMLEGEGHLFPVKRAWMYMEAVPLGLPGKSFQGDAFFTAPNPPFGAVFTYYLKDGLETLKEKRHEAEKKAEEDEDIETPFYPSWEDLKQEDREEKPSILLTVTDQDGAVVRRLTGPVKAGIHRVAWDFRLPPSEPVRLKPPEFQSPWDDPPRGPMSLPGEYTVTLAKRVNGETTTLGVARKVEAIPLGLGILTTRDKVELLAFQKKVARLQRAVLGAGRVAGEAANRLSHLKKALLDTPGAGMDLSDELLSLENRLKDIQEKLTGDAVRRKYAEPYRRSIEQRVDRIVYGQWTSTSPPTRTNRDAYRIAGEAFTGVLADLRALVEKDLESVEDRLEAAGAPWTPGRLPRWTME
jgi:hypothetical protein